MRLRDAGLVLREVDGDMVLLDLEGSAYFVSNPSGTFLLQLLRSECDRELLIAELAREFGLTAEEAATDTDAFLAMLDEQDLLSGPPHQ